jgi:hypothetical protein
MIFSLSHSIFEELLIIIPNGKLCSSTKDLRVNKSFFGVLIPYLISIGIIPNLPCKIKSISALFLYLGLHFITAECLIYRMAANRKAYFH